jgi:hypothetical protein
MTTPIEFTTSKGTLLPLLNLKGKPYLQVAHRIVWFREDHPTWNIKTSILEANEVHALMLAQVINDNGNVISNAHKRCLAKGDMFYIEKAETGAIGRALALIGYGTQFAGDDLDESDVLADSPIHPARSTSRWGVVFNEVNKLLAAPRIKEMPRDELGDMMEGLGFSSWNAVLEASADELEQLVIALKKEVTNGR